MYGKREYGNGATRCWNGINKQQAQKHTRKTKYFYRLSPMSAPKYRDIHNRSGNMTAVANPKINLFVSNSSDLAMGPFVMMVAVEYPIP